MTNALYIDGINVFNAYGVFMLDGCYNGILSYPKLKEIAKNDWAEIDGIEVDLSTPKLDAKKFSISFGATKTANLNGFLAVLINKAFHSFNFAQIGLTKSLRLVSCTDFKGNFSSLRTFSMEFSDDAPLSGYTYAAPISTTVAQRGYTIDTLDLSNYGITILEGSNAEILKPCSIKPNLTVNVKSLSGEIYDNEMVVYQSKEVKLNCLLLASSLAEFWQNYNAFLFDLVRPNERMFGFNNFKYACYYKASSVSKFSITGKIMCQFSLTLVFTKQGVTI